MKQFSWKLTLSAILLMTGVSSSWAQNIISGTVKDAGNGRLGLAGVNIGIKGTGDGTTTDLDGNFKLSTSQNPPYTLVVSFIGYQPREVVISSPQANVNIVIGEEALLGQEVVVSASRVEENILKSPVTVEKMDLIAVKGAATPDYYDALANVKGVQVNNGSMNFTAVNTRGFATIANTRFVQLVDGMDTQAPLLNFPTGTIMGLTELDVESVEIVPGAASALYGPNAFNGIMTMTSKDPFEFQGLSAQIKGGMTNSTAGGAHPMGQGAFRYAKALSDKFAVKVNFSYMQATDWYSNDYKTDKNNPESKYDLSKNPNFNGVNLYGDENNFNVPIPVPGYPVLNLNRTGFQEGLLLDNRIARTIKGDVALHYKITDKITASATYRYGGGNSIYQGQAKYALRDFNQQFFKAELKGENWFVRGYLSATDAGKSYNLDALGAYTNEALAPTATKWAPDYANGYVLSMQGINPFTGASDASTTGNVAASNAQARKYADRNIFDPTTGAPLPGVATAINTVRKNFFQKTPPGASFYDNSKLWHAEAFYNFKKIKFVDLIAGGNFRQYSLFSNATIFDEAPVDANNPKRIFINQYGVYTQASKTVVENLKLTASIRYDKMDDFKGRFTPRVSGVYTVNQYHNFRASFQTGFRMPDTQAQYIYFDNPSGILLGGNPKNASRYGIYNGGAWTAESYNAYIASGGSVSPTGTTTGGNAALLKTANIPYIKPEQLWSYEVGYKGVIANKLLLDVNYYYTSYSNFLGEQYVNSMHQTAHQGQTKDAGTLWYPYANSPYTLKSQGVGVGLTYNLPKNFAINGNYNFATFSGQQSTDFQAGFNTPKNKFSIGLSNRKLTKNLGFNVNYRYQQTFLWQSSYGVWHVPAYGVVDAQISYSVVPKTTVKIGGTNIGGGDYRTNFGAPFIGQQYYISLTFDNLLK